MPSVDPALFRFLDLFNEGRYWDSHEALEQPWRSTRSELYHALILFASAFVHVGRGNPHGITAQLAKAEPILETLRPRYLGLDIDAILQHSAACRQIVADHPNAQPHTWPHLTSAPTLTFDPALVRGTEPELLHDS